MSVLLVDDRPENLLALEALLEPLEVRTVRSTSGADAVRRVRGEDFAVVLLDVMMPVMDGFDTAQAIRDLPDVAAPPIIFLTAASIDTRAWTARGYALGAADYLMKPVDPDALRAKVSVFVELARARREVERASILRTEYARAQAAQAAAERHAEELARLNEQLQQQAEELEAANEELRVTADELAEQTEAARAAEHRIRFLAEASETLASSLDYEVTLAAVARLAVPSLADWCAVDMVDVGGHFRRLAVEHPDPAMVRLAQDLDARYPEDPSAPQGRYNVLRTRRSEYMAEIPEGLLEAGARDAEHREIIRRLGLRSYMTVPLLARDGRVLGVMTFVSAESRRQYGAADVALAEDLARRAATAIENATLVRELSESREQMEQQATELEMQAAELQESHEEMEVANEELRGANDALVAARAEAERANRAKAEFLASMSHELRTPLNATLGYVELIEMGLRGPVTDEMRSDLARIQRSQRHLLSLVNDILNFARLEAGRVDYHIADVRAGEALAELDALISPQVRAKGLEYHSEECDPEIAVRADREKLRQVLLNLLTNAVKFTARGGRVSIRCETEPAAGTVRIAVADTGRGIPRDQMGRIFEPFVQVDRHLTHESQQGVGLGLAISRDLVRGMGGTLTAESEVGVGSTFTIVLPRGKENGGSSVLD